MTTIAPVPTFALDIIARACRQQGVDKTRRAVGVVGASTWVRARGGCPVDARVREAIVAYAETYAQQHPGERHGF